MTRSDPSHETAREGHVAALRELHLALRRAHEALRHAHHLLAPFHAAFNGVRPFPRSPKQVASPSRLGFTADRSNSTFRFAFVVPGPESNAMEDLRADFRTHVAHIQLLKEENRHLCDTVGRMIGQRRTKGWPTS
ncbi:MAG: hypothetical protein AB1679_02480 [Actinomycetota bacterium]|jgi:hypothetical protein